MKNLLIAICIAVTLSGCAIFKNLRVEDVKVLNVSVVDGITVSVKGLECSFSFTTDREKILDEIKSCLINNAINTSQRTLLGLNSASMTVPQAVLDPKLNADANKATALVLAEIK